MQDNTYKAALSKKQLVTDKFLEFSTVYSA